MWFTNGNDPLPTPPAAGAGPGDLRDNDVSSVIFHIAAAGIPEGVAPMRFTITDPDKGERMVMLSPLGLVLLAAAAQRGNGALIAPLNLEDVSGSRITDEAELLVQHGLAQEDGARTIVISALGRAMLDAIESED